VTDDDYQRDYSAGLNGSAGRAGSPGYLAGEAARIRAEENSARIRAAGQQMSIEVRRNPFKFYVVSVIQTISASIVVGLLAGGFALVQGKPPLAWALPAAGVTAALFAIVLTAFSFGLALGLLYRLVVTLAATPFVLWRWLLAFGAMGAVAGFALATAANRTTMFAQQQAIDYGVKGLLVGFAFGALYRLIRALGRRGRSRVAPKARA
jgi:hypothetical protein